MKTIDPPANPAAHPSDHPSPAWNERCQAILLANARHLNNIEIVQAIEAVTGLRFHDATISRRRKLLGIPSPRRRTFSAALMRARQLAAHDP
jgi:hypothetical protein